MENILREITNYLLGQSWQIAAVFVAVAAACWLLRRSSAHWRYLLWLVVLVKCLIPPILTVPLAVLPASEAVERGILTVEAVPVVSEVTEASGLPLVIEPSGAPVATEQVEGPLAGALVASAVDPGQPIAEAGWTIRHWLIVCWMAGVAGFILLCVFRAWRTQGWLRRDRRAASSELQNQVASLTVRLGMGTVPKVWLIGGISQPFVWGLLRGAVYLPTNFERISKGEDRRGILGHELAHILRWDAAVNSLQAVVQAFFFFHPAVWWANRKIRQEREKCCDEVAIASLAARPRQYSSAIVDVLVSEYESSRRVPSLAVAGPVKNIEERIKTMMRPNKKFYKRPTWLAVISVLIVAALAIPTALVLTARAEPESATQAANSTNLKVLDLRFEPIAQGKNIVRVKVQNTSELNQTFAIHIQTRSPDYGPSGVGWGTPFLENIGGQKTKWLRFVFKIQGPITDKTWARLRFYNPDSPDAYDFKKFFAEKKFTSRDLPQKLPLASPEQQNDITNAFLRFQDNIRKENYKQAWEQFTRDYQQAEFQKNGFEKFKSAMDGKPGMRWFVWSRPEFIELQPQSVTKKNGALALIAIRDGQIWTIDFVKDNGLWKIDSITGYIPEILHKQAQPAQPATQPTKTVPAQVHYTFDTDQGLEIISSDEGMKVGVQNGELRVWGRTMNTEWGGDGASVPVNDLGGSLDASIDFKLPKREDYGLVYMGLFPQGQTGPPMILYQWHPRRALWLFKSGKSRGWYQVHTMHLKVKWWLDKGRRTYPDVGKGDTEFVTMRMYVRADRRQIDYYVDGRLVDTLNLAQPLGRVTKAQIAFESPKLGYNYDIRFDNLKISSAPPAKSTPAQPPQPATQPGAELHSVVYDINDLISGQESAVIKKVGWVGQAGLDKDKITETAGSKAEASAQQIITTIKGKISPASWESAGGAASIKLTGNRLVITQTPENHQEIRKLLEELREERQPSVRVESRFFAVSAKADERLKQWLSKQLGITFPGVESSAELSAENARQLIRETQKSRDITTLVSPRVILANGTGAYIYVTLDKQTVRLPLLGGQGETAEMTFNAGGELGLDKVVTSPDGRFVTLSLNVTFADLSTANPDGIQTETAKHSSTVSLPAGHTVLLRLPFVKKKVVGISGSGVPGSLGSTTEDVVENTDPHAKPERYLYILIKPTIVAKPETEPTFPMLKE